MSSGRTKDINRVTADGNTFHFPRKEDFSARSTTMDKYKKNLKCIGSYSEDERKLFQEGKSKLAFLKMEYRPDVITKTKAVRFDLNAGQSKTIPHDGTPEKGLDNVLTWISRNKGQLLKELKMPGGQRRVEEGGNFVSKRGLFVKIMTILNVNNEDSDFYATWFNGTVFLLDRNPVTLFKSQAREVVISKWAHKFEQYMTEDDVEDELICNRNFRCVLSSTLGPHKLLFSGSIDCVNPKLYEEKMPDLSAAVALKCSLSDCSDDYTKRHKMVFWAVSMVLSGIGEVIIGTRNKNGVVHKLESRTTEDLMREGKKFFDLDICFDFASELLSFVKQRTESNPGSVLYFSKRRNTHFITCSEVDDKEFLPEWFTNEMLLPDAKE